MDQQSLSDEGSCSGGVPIGNQKLNLTSLSSSTQPVVLYKKDDSLITDDDANNLPTVTGGHDNHLTIYSTLPSSPDKPHTYQEDQFLG